MAANDWTSLCRGSDLEIEGNRIRVAVSQDRWHRVQVMEREDAYDLSAVVAQKALLQDLNDASLRAWLTNRGTELVGFRVDEKGKMVGEAWVPKAGVTPEEFQLYVKRFAIECDRFEFLLTGMDRE